MSTQKRRVVYFSDEAWAMAKRHAKKHSLSVSDWLRALVVANAFDEQQVRKASEAPTLAEASRILEEALVINHPALINVSRDSDPANSFVRFRPAPKPSQKHR